MSLEPSYCGNCGAYLPSGESFCMECGHKRILPPLNSLQPSQIFDQPSYGESVHSSNPYNQLLNNQSSYNQWFKPAYNVYQENYNNQSINPLLGLLIFFTTILVPLIPILSLIMFLHYWRNNKLRAAKQVFNITFIAVFISIFVSIAFQLWFPEFFGSSCGP